MNSMRLFNKEYLFQNIKKSLGPLCVFVCIIPILNFILLLFLAISNNNGYIFDLDELSMFNYVGIFVIPLVLSICFFGFIFKKKSVDFMNSMPISRASIFITNTIGGILILFLMMLVNVILIGVVSICFSNVILPFNLILDYFIFWLVSYIFIFTASNIAVSLSGNAVTSIVLTALILFLLPFCHDYITQKQHILNDNIYIKCDDKSCIPNNYVCTGISNCKLKVQDNIYYLYDKSIVTDSNYTMPYDLIHSLFVTGNSIDFRISKLIKMFILSIIYIFIGLFAFSKRKMENCETSFKNINIHLLVKCLTLVPIVAFLYESISLDNDLSSIIIILFLLALVLTYYFIYDLITKHGIKNIKRSLAFFIITVLVLYCSCSVNDYIVSHKKSNKVINSSDIEKISIDDRYYENANLINITSSDRNIINTIISYGLNNSYDEDNDKYLNVKYFTKDRTIEKTVVISEKEYNNLLKTLSNDDTINKKLMKKIKTNKIAYRLDRNYFKYDSELEKILNNIDDINIYEYYQIYSSSACGMALYEYSNHKVSSHYIPCNLSDELYEYISTKRENILKEALEGDYDIYISLSGDLDESIYYNYDYVYDLVLDDLLIFIKNNISSDYDASKDGCILSLYFENREYDYYTNDIDTIVKIINSKVDEIKDTDEYKKYIEDLGNDKYE